MTGKEDQLKSLKHWLNPLSDWTTLSLFFLTLVDFVKPLKKKKKNWNISRAASPNYFCYCCLGNTITDTWIFIYTRSPFFPPYFPFWNQVEAEEMFKVIEATYQAFRRWIQFAVICTSTLKLCLFYQNPLNLLKAGHCDKWVVSDSLLQPRCWQLVKRIFFT